jgi:hypothetical protein
MKKSIILLLAMTACVGHPVSKPGITQAQLDADVASCNYEVHKAGASSNNNDPFGAGIVQGNLFNECLAMKGYK